MKALSLWQPWASMMADGLKLNETRSWKTDYRGDLVICASKRKPEGIYNPLVKLTPDEVYTINSALKAEMALGCALCIVEVYDCVATVNVKNHSTLEKYLGNYLPGRFAWLTRNLRPLREPVSVIGRQGLFNLPPHKVALIQAQLTQ